MSDDMLKKYDIRDKVELLAAFDRDAFIPRLQDALDGFEDCMESLDTEWLTAFCGVEFMLLDLLEQGYGLVPMKDLIAHFRAKKVTEDANEDPAVIASVEGILRLATSIDTFNILEAAVFIESFRKMHEEDIMMAVLANSGILNDTIEAAMNAAESTETELELPALTKKKTDKFNLN